ncbi:MAG: DUF2461 domain-containing protein [Ignavibacteria bacterium]|nr:DUF2461 domain-containing protein [Ignavibacteria bacterium]
MLDSLVKEPFLGFQPESLEFLSKLQNPRYNNKKWFDKNREIYEVYLKQPMRVLIDTLSVEIKKIDPNIVVNYKSIFRINRDIRFTKDKTPYKSHLAASFCFDMIKKPDIPQFYFHFSPTEFLVAGGQYSTDPHKLKKIRNEIYTNYPRYKKIVSIKKFVKAYKNVLGEKTSRLPKGYEKKADELLIETLKMKQFYVDEFHNPDVIFDSSLVELITKNMKQMYNFVKFLHNALI